MEALEQVEESLEKTRSEIKRFKAAGEQARVHQILERDGLHDMLRQMKHKMKKDMNPKVLRETPLKQYSQCMKSVSYQSAYVLTFEARMCRSLHIMAILEEQLAITKEECKARIDNLEGTGAHEKEEELRVEMDILNKLVLAENGKRDMEDTYKDILRKQEEALGKLEREAWGRSLTEFSLEESSFVLPSIQEEKDKEGRLASMLDHSMMMQHPPNAFKLEDMSLGTAEVTGRSLAADSTDFLVMEDEDSTSSEEEGKRPEMDDGESENGYNNEKRHDDQRHVAFAEGYNNDHQDKPSNARNDDGDSSSNEDEEVEMSDSSSDVDAEFLSPEEADSQVEAPWRRSSKEFSQKLVTDDEHNDYEDTPDFGLVQDVSDDETFPSIDDTTDDDGSEFQSPEEANVNVQNPWRLSSSQDKYVEMTSRENEQEQQLAPVTDDEEEDSESEDEEYSYERTEGDSEDDGDDGSEFQSPEEADVSVQNPWRRSSSQDKYPEREAHDVEDEHHAAPLIGDGAHSESEEEEYSLERTEGDSDDDGSEFQSPEEADVNVQNPWRRSSSQDKYPAMASRGGHDEDHIEPMHYDGEHFQDDDQGDDSKPIIHDDYGSDDDHSNGSDSYDEETDLCTEMWREECAQGYPTPNRQVPEQSHNNARAIQNPYSRKEDGSHPSDDEETDLNTEMWREQCEYGMTRPVEEGHSGPDDNANPIHNDYRSEEHDAPHPGDDEETDLNTEMWREQCEYGLTRHDGEGEEEPREHVQDDYRNKAHNDVEENSRSSGSEDDESWREEAGYGINRNVDENSESDYSDEESVSIGESWNEGSTLEGDETTEASSKWNESSTVQDSLAETDSRWNESSTVQDSLTEADSRWNESSTIPEDLTEADSSWNEPNKIAKTEVNEPVGKSRSPSPTSRTEDDVSSQSDVDASSESEEDESSQSDGSESDDSSSSYTETDETESNQYDQANEPVKAEEKSASYGHEQPQEEDRSPRSVMDMRHLTRDATQRFSNTSSSVRRSPSPDYERSSPSPQRGRSMQAVPVDGPNSGRGQYDSNANGNQNVRFADETNGMMQPGVKMNSYPNVAKESMQSEKVSRSPRLSHERTKNRVQLSDNPAFKIEDIIGPPRRDRSVTPTRNQRPTIGKSLSSQALLLQIEKQSWYCSDLTKHALEDDEGWEIDRGQGRIQPLAKHRISALLETDSVCGSRV